MGSFSNFLENEILDHILLTGSYTPANLYIGLYTSTPDDTGGGTEVSGNNYSRVQHESWDVSSSGASENTSDITFPTANGNWGTIIAFGIFDASTGGNLLVWGAVPSQEVVDTNTPVFAAGALDITLD